MGPAKPDGDGQQAGEREIAAEAITSVSGGTGKRKNPKAVSKPERSLPVPAGMEGKPLPFFLKAAAVPDETSSAEIGEEKATPIAGEAAPLTPQEAAAVEEAAEIFAHAMEAVPTKSETEPVYEDWWRASTLRAEEHLRAVLGWDRFNRLSLDAAREFLAESAR